MRKIILSFIVLILWLPISSRAQLPVVDMVNATISRSQIVKELQQLAKLTRQINTLRRQLQYAKSSFERQIKNLKRLPDANWSSVRAIQQNLNRVNNAARNMAYMRKFIQQQYVGLYDAAKRLDIISNNPEMAKEYEKKRQKHMVEEANQVIATAETNIKTTEEDYEYLKKVESQMNRNELTPQQMRQIQAEVQALSAQQLIEIKRIVAQHASFAARQYRQALGRKRDQKAAASQFDKRFSKDFKAWKKSLSDDKQQLIPEWVKNEN